MSALSDVKRVLGDTLQLGTKAEAFTPETRLFGSIPELDSMSIVNVVLGLEEHFGFVVDDDEIVLLATQELLCELGYRVQSCKNGEEAFETYRLNPNTFDLVITDLTMPGMNGFEMSKKILELCPDQPVILCTGLGESTIKEKAIAIGVTAFVEKPMITQKVAKTIRSILD